MGVAGHDQNFVPTLTALSSTDGTTIIPLYADPTTHRLLVDSASGTGTVTSVSVVTANGFAGSVANATTTPAITLSTTITGVLKGDGTAISAASAGTDYVAPGLITSSGLTMGTGKLLGRSTASTGSVEQITIGTGLSLSGGTLTSSGGSLTIGTTTISSGTDTFILFDNAGVLGEKNVTGSGNVVLATSPTLITPVLGAATATSINNLTITSSTGTLTIAGGKTFTVNKSLILTGTDSTTMTFPSTSASVARTDAAQTFTGTQTFTQVITTNNAITASGNAATVPITSKINTVTNNSASGLTITMTTGAVDRQPAIVCILDSSSATQSITWVNTENSATSAPVVTNGSTTLPLTVGFMYNNATSKWRCVASS